MPTMFVSCIHHDNKRPTTAADAVERQIKKGVWECSTVGDQSAAFVGRLVERLLTKGVLDADDMENLLDDFITVEVQP